MQSVAPSFTTEPSAALLEAQARLLQLRAQQGIVVTRPSSAAPRPVEPPAPQPQPVSWLLANAEKELAQRREQAGVQVAAPSAAPSPLAALIATAQARLQETDQRSVSTSCPPIPSPQSLIPVHPTLLLALLRQHREAPGRVYLLLRVIDHDGRGWLDVADVRRQLTGKGSPLRICGWRRLRQLLHEGEGVFWRRDDGGRLWLMGLHRIAYALDLKRLQGFPVELPVAALLGGIQDVRAAFYAAFHSGRDAKPISRETLRDLSGVAERTQRTYDRRARVTARRNLAIGERYATAEAQERAWGRGRGVFRFIDVRGQQGPPNKEYIAWQLPNSYEAAYQRRSRGSRKRLNRKLKDLVTKGIPGNVEATVERVFFGNGALAARAYNRDPERDAYWAGREPTRRRAQLWRVMSGRAMVGVGR
jgi:hypothetical protein